MSSLSPLRPAAHALVTGGRGIVGRRLIETLVERGVHVRASYRSEGSGSAPCFEHPLVTWLEGDLRDPDFCLSLCANSDIVFHLAAHRRTVAHHREHREEVMKDNEAMSAALIEALRSSHLAPRIVFLSTANIAPDVPLDALVNSEDGYIAGKAKAESLWRSFAEVSGSPLLILRPVGIYGPHDRFALDGNVIPSLVVQACTQPQIRLWGDGTQTRPFLYVDDLVKTMLLFLEHDTTETEYVTPPNETALKDLAVMITKIVHKDLPIVTDPSKPTGKIALNVAPNHRLLHGFAWTPLEEGLRKTVEAYMTQSF